MVGYLKNSENSEDRELALQKPKKEMGGPRRTRTEMRHDHMTLAKTRTLSR
jgi:hypothetical protein